MTCERDPGVSEIRNSETLFALAWFELVLRQQVTSNLKWDLGDLGISLCFAKRGLLDVDLVKYSLNDSRLQIKRMVTIEDSKDIIWGTKCGPLLGRTWDF